MTERNLMSQAEPAEVAGLLKLLRRSGTEVECRVTGTSMGGAVPDGSAVRLIMDGAAKAAAGDAVAVLLGGESFSIHRLVARGRSPRARGFVITHGDGNVFCDAPQRAEDLVGLVVSVRPADGAPWQPVASAPRQGLARTAITRGFEQAMALALEISPSLAIALKNLLVLLMTPLVWLRPYQSGQERSTSRLVAASRSAIAARPHGG